MTLNKSKGNMYPWITHTWNPIRGKCPHGCVYCFMKDRDVGPLRLDEKALRDVLGYDRTIFVGSSTDMWAPAVPDKWILRVLEIIDAHSEWSQNSYIFQSKNPSRFFQFAEKIRPRTILGTTLESNRQYGQSIHAPLPAERAAAFVDRCLQGFRKMVSIEPIVAFDLEIFSRWIKAINPTFVSIGADSKGHNLIEPTAQELKDLVVELSTITEIKLKKNVDRLLEGK